MYTSPEARRTYQAMYLYANTAESAANALSLLACRHILFYKSITHNTTPCRCTMDV